MRNLLLVFFTLLSFFAYSQKPLTWMTLKYVEFEMVWDSTLEAHKMYPTFEQRILDLDGQEVEISGYIIPYSLDEGTFVLSAKPFSECFFCGGAGPESVLSLKFITENKFTVDDYVKVKGKFRLNSNDVYEMFYILDNAEIIN